YRKSFRYRGPRLNHAICVRGIDRARQPSQQSTRAASSPLSVATARVLLGLLSSSPTTAVRAQDSSNAPESNTENEEITEITVTGTRLAHYIAPTPVTAISTEELQAKAARDVAGLVEDLPALRPNFNTGQVSAPIGASYLDLRALGPNRTLLLVDGRRFGATDNTGGVDINIIPAILIKRIEIVTGGASAA